MKGYACLNTYIQDPSSDRGERREHPVREGLWDDTHVHINVCPASLTLKRAQYTSLTNDRQLREEGRKGGRKRGGQEASTRDRNMQDAAGSRLTSERSREVGRECSSGWRHR